MNILTFFLPFIILFFFLTRDTQALFRLYKKKKNPDFPIVQEDIYNYFDSVSRFLRIYLTPIIMWQIILQRHKDKELNDAAKKVRRLLFVGLGIWIVQILIVIYSWGWFA